MFVLYLAFVLYCVKCELPPAGYPSYQARVAAAIDTNWLAPPSMTSDGLDAILQRNNGEIFIFKGDQMWETSKLIATSIESVFGDILQVSSRDGIDAAFQRSNGRLYVFAGELYWRFTDGLLIGEGDQWILNDNYPKKISQGWKGVPDDIDAVFQLPNEHIYFFKQDMYYRVRDKYLNPTAARDRPDYVNSCYPKPIADQFLGVTVPVRTAFRRRSDGYIYFFDDNNQFTVNYDKYLQLFFLDRLQTPSQEILPKRYCVSDQVVTDVTPVPTADYDAIWQRKTGKIYIFKGDQYWRLTDFNFSPHLTDCLDTGYPKDIAASFPGLPAGSPVDAVFSRDNGKIYFFVGTQYYRFSDKYLVPEADPTLPDVLDAGYPKSITNFGIPDADVTSATGLLGAFQRPNGKIFIFLDFAGEVKYYRITDKYLTEGALEDVVDPGYPKDLAEGFEDVPVPFDTVFQRTESDQKIYFYAGTNFTIGYDKYIHLPSLCTACEQN